MVAFASLTVLGMGLRAARRMQTAAADVDRTLKLRLALATLTELNAEAASAFGINQDSVTATRKDAMSIPALRRGRAIICGVGATLPLVALDLDGNPHHRPPAWLDAPDPNTTLANLITWTLDDLLFYPCAWWRVTSRDFADFPLSFERLSPERVAVTQIQRGGRLVGQVYVDGRPEADANLVRFDGPDEGLLRYGGRTVQTFIALDKAVRKFARLDVPLGYLRPADGTPELTRDQIDALLDDWEDARETRTTAYLNRAVEYATVQFDATKIQLAEARQQAAVDCARLLNLAPRYVAAPTGDSSTYSNVEGDRRELFDLTLAPYLTAIGQRLSMGDVTRPHTRVRFDRAAWVRGDLLTVMQAAQIGVEVGAIDAAEVRTEYLGRPARPELTDRPTPAPAPKESNA